MSFPLYSNLVSELEKNEVNISNDSINNFIAFIKVADKQCIELVYALIKKYDIEHENSNDLLPYKGKQLKTGYKFEGTMRKAVYIRGELIDLHLFSLLKENSKQLI